MNWLRKLAAWYLQRDIRGIVTTKENGCPAGWIYGRDWFLCFGTSFIKSQDSVEDHRACDKACDEAMTKFEVRSWGYIETTEIMNFGEAEELKHLRLSCQIATKNTRGNYFCTRDRGHDGPCAAVPV